MVFCLGVPVAFPLPLSSLYANQGRVEPSLPSKDSSSRLPTSKSYSFSGVPVSTWFSQLSAAKHHSRTYHFPSSA
ncbi:hypothetical protein LIER_11186 [Lithospermum erythrorhizon]|uniref:Secreted protein n=1 Tax=Lithospermum erythrorhizon TaxID=34254 RepID=A0AAV3PM66_LITER